MSLAPGVTLGPYEILSPIGAGDMGQVYKARDTRLNRTVAIKVLPDHFATDLNLKQIDLEQAQADPEFLYCLGVWLCRPATPSKRSHLSRRRYGWDSFAIHG